LFFTKRTNKKITCCITGPRSKSLSFGFHEDDPRCVRLKEVLREQIINMTETFRVTHFITSVGLGVDLFAAETVLELKKEHPQCTLECAIPYETPATWWTEKQRDRYFSIIEKCDKEALIQNHYSSDCFKICNEYMLRESDYLLAVWNGRRGRTATAISLARSRNVHVIIINPDTFEVSPNIHLVKSDT